jgi:hypothetical protein
MRRKDAVELLRVILQEWDGSLIDTRAASKILSKIQKQIGMLPPDRLSHLPAPCEIAYEWDTKIRSK